MSKNLGYLSGRKGLSNNLFERVAQEVVADGDLASLAREFIMGTANTYGTASFYDFLKPENQGKKIYVCNGSACKVAGTQAAVYKELEKRFKEEEIGEMCCLGRCYENSSFHFNGTNYSGNDLNKLEIILKGKPVSPRPYPAKADVNDPVHIRPFPGIREYYQLLDEVLRRPKEAVIDTIESSGLRGRGGAGFPMAVKLRACLAATGKQKFIVCNADEGDPAAYTDRYLLEYQPHAVLLGMLIAGYAAGAGDGVLYIRAEYPECVATISRAVKELSDAGWIGEDIRGSGFAFRFKVIKAAGAYICGEETALLSSIEGQRPEVRVRPPFPAEEGLFNLPTIVNNVETLACLPFIFKKGPEAFKQYGNGKSTGTKLICFDSNFNRPGVCEVKMGTPLRRAVDELGGGFKQPVKALHIGGPLGGLVPLSKIDDLTLDFESFAANGFLLGHGSILAIPSGFPMVKYIRHLFAFTAHESCGKCFPCRLGSVRGEEMFAKAMKEDYRIDPKLLDDLLHTLQVGSLCALGGGVPLPIRNALQYFSDELKPHFKPVTA
jgi:NADH-quinone oxidoreductase subunit F